MISAVAFSVLPNSTFPGYGISVSWNIVSRGFIRRAARKASKKRGKKVNRVEVGTSVSEFAKHIDCFHKKIHKLSLCGN